MKNNCTYFNIKKGDHRPLSTLSTTMTSSPKLTKSSHIFTFTMEAISNRFWHRMRRIHFETVLLLSIYTLLSTISLNFTYYHIMFGTTTETKISFCNENNDNNHNNCHNLNFSNFNIYNNTIHNSSSTLSNSYLIYCIVSSGFALQAMFIILYPLVYYWYVCVCIVLCIQWEHLNQVSQL